MRFSDPMPPDLRVPVEGGELVARTSGSGPVAVLLHGGPGLSDYLGPLADELDGVFRCVRYQQRGVEPAPTAGPLDVAAHVADALAVVEAVGGEAWLVGHSWGGHLALHAAVEAPHHVRGLVLVDPLGVEDDGCWDEMDAAIDARLPADVKAELERVESELEGAADVDDVALRALRLVWPVYFADPPAAPPVPDDLRAGQAAYEAGRTSTLAWLEAGTLRRELPDLDLPALVVHGRHDPLPLSAAEGIVRHLRGSRLVVLEDCGHFPWLERPGSVAGPASELLREAA